MNILIVDDEPAILLLLTDLLQVAGHTTDTYSNGPEAIDAFARRANSYDVAILDLALPQMDGIQIFQELRRIRTDLPIVILTGHFTREVPDDCHVFYKADGLAALIKSMESLRVARLGYDATVTAGKPS